MYYCYLKLGIVDLMSLYFEDVFCCTTNKNLKKKRLLFIRSITYRKAISRVAGWLTIPEFTKESQTTQYTVRSERKVFLHTTQF